MNKKTTFSFKPQFILFIFPLIYIAYFLFQHFTGSHRYGGDEGDYISIANSLIDGSYFSSSEDIDISKGPGYPIFLTPFVAIGLSRHWLALISILLTSISVFLLYRLSSLFLNSRQSLIVASIWGAYYPHHYDVSFFVLSEPLAVLLILSSFYYFTLYLRSNRNTYLIAAALLFGWLILVKVIFAYILVILILTSIIAMILKKRIGRVLLSFSLIAYIILAPYQFLTYRLTGHPFFLSTTAGQQLYWMSTPHPGEYGDYQSSSFTINCFYKNSPCMSDLVEKNHGEIYERAEKMNKVERSNFLLQNAKYNIKNNPFKYLKNIVSNVSRMYYNFPRTYLFERDKTIARIIPNSYLFCSMTIAALLSIRFFSKIPLSIKIYLYIITIYLGMSSLVSAYPRMLGITVPIILIWIFNIYNLLVESYRSNLKIK